MCTIKMRLSCRRFSVSHACFGHLFCIFPSYFLSFFLVQFSSRVYISFKLPFSVLRSLVSSSRSCFFSCYSMVDYSSVRLDFPSVAFLFARLGCLFKFVEESCLNWVSLFVKEDCPLLSSLFPLVSHSAKVVRSLKMSEVRSSALEMGLSSSDDRVTLEATSCSTFYKAWNISCPLTVKDE